MLIVSGTCIGHVYLSLCTCAAGRGIRTGRTSERVREPETSRPQKRAGRRETVQGRAQCKGDLNTCLVRLIRGYKPREAKRYQSACGPKPPVSVCRLSVGGLREEKREVELSGLASASHIDNRIYRRSCRRAAEKLA